MNITYYVINESEIALLDSNKDDFEEILNNQILFFHEYKDLPFWKQNTEFGQGVKAWNPMLELLIKIDLTESEAFKKIISKIIHRESSFLKLPQKSVNDIWNSIKTISVDQIEKSLANNELKDSIKKTAGYNMTIIDNHNTIIMEFIEFFKAIYEANQRSENLIILIN